MIPKEVTALLDTFIASSDTTIENYTTFANIFWKTTKKAVADVTADDILKFLTDGIKKYKWKPSTSKQYATIALRIFGALRDEAFVKEMHKKFKILPRVQDHAALYEGNYVPTNRINDFIKAAPNEEYACFYTMILKWGLRMMEALTVTPSNINVPKNRVIVGGKGFGGMGKIRQIFVEKATIDRVLKFAREHFQQTSGRKPTNDFSPIIKTIKPRMAEYQWKATAQKIGLKNWAKLTPHDGRHSYAIDFLIKRKKEGMSALILLKNQLGHTSITTTQIYLDIAGGEAEDVFNAGLDNTNDETQSP